MRLVDADILIELIENRKDNIPANDFDIGWNNAIEAILDEVYNAPTEEGESYAKGYQDGAEDGLQGIRPKGKWEDDFQEDLDFMSRKGWKCSYCKWRTNYGTPNFCMNCGADMRKGEE